MVVDRTVIMRISPKLQQAHESNGLPTYSFEFFVPKTSQGLQNLYDRMDRMYELEPQFIDITWNAGGRLSNLTCEMVQATQSVIGLETCMHLTCAGMPQEMVDNALQSAYNSGCQNILALRGDPVKEGSENAKFAYAKDLVKHIREKYGDYFDIGVAGYPEGHPEEDNIDLLIDYLKEKIDAGANFIITQMFYDVDNFIEWVSKCRKKGIMVPIIPGIMPISTYASFLRRAKWCEINIPAHFMEVLEPISGDDSLVRQKGTELVADMCRKMLAAGINHLHFYTMNLERATTMVLENLGILPEYVPEAKTPPPLPWRQSLALGRHSESVRPIFWKNRKQSYVTRTQDWDEFPNGRWGDSRSPAYGELETYGVVLKYTSAKAIELWGNPTTIHDLGNLFADYIAGKVNSLPWSDAPISSEVQSITQQLIDLNKRNILTINSQPAVNGVRSNHPVHGWGPSNGYVYQKAYLEVLVPPTMIETLTKVMNSDSDVTYYLLNKKGNLTTNSPVDSPNAVTWGIYPGKEVIQPTIVEKISFLAWKDEVFRLADEWANCFNKESLSYKLIKEIADNWYLVNIVHNDFHRPHAIFELFNNL